MPTIQQLGFLLYTAVAVMQQVAEATAKGPIDQRVWGHACTLSAELKKASGATQGLINRIGDALDKQQLLSPKLNVFIHMQSSNKRKKELLPILYSLADAAPSSAAAAKQALTTALLYTTHATYEAGRLDEFGLLLQSMGSATGKTCIGSNSCAAETGEDVKTSFVGCEAKLVTPLEASVPDSLPSPDALLEPTADQTHSTGGSATDCPLTDDTGTENLLNGGGVLGTTTFTAANAKFKKTDAAGCQASASQGLQATHYFLKELKDSDTRTKGAAGNKTADDIIKEQNFKEYLKKVLAAETLPDNSVIDTIYGKETDDFRKAFWGHVEETVIPKEATGRNEDTKLGAINTLKELHLATIYYQTQTWDTFAEQAETIKNIQDKGEKKYLKAAETTCNAAKDNQDECDKLKEKGCVFNKDGEKDKKCTLIK
uniref:Variant surface glycoprotein 1125.1288 n=1 Tax=Trypanosoma brucei TaxID=5691 RepID=A0A1J0R4J5_9TRYP|nr:variant surface glycoprotein 1125.1288 [Trypanosoma brucei]